MRHLNRDSWIFIVRRHISALFFFDKNNCTCWISLFFPPISVLIFFIYSCGSVGSLTELCKILGAKGVQVEELMSADMETLDFMSYVAYCLFFFLVPIISTYLNNKPRFTTILQACLWLYLLSTLYTQQIPQR
jgi:hypothetical protein